LPTPALNLRKSSTATFEIWPLRFDIDEFGRLWDVISRSIYTERYDFIRELTQNSIDACLRTIYDDNFGKLSTRSPRNWQLAGYSPGVVIFFFESTRELAVIDNGIGMSKDELGLFLFKVAACGMKSQRSERQFPFPAIANFGIGFVSVLTRSVSVRITTRRRLPDSAGNPQSGFTAELDSNLRDAFVENADGAPIGTSVTLQLTSDYSYEGIISYFRMAFRFPAVPIHIVSWNRLCNLEILFRLITSEELLPHFDSLGSRIRLGLVKMDDVLENVTKASITIAMAAKKIGEKRPGDGIVMTNETEILRVASEPPVEHIESIRPPSPPISRPIVFELSIQNVVEVTRAYYPSTKTRRRSKLTLLIVPVAIADQENGIELSTLHAFLVSHGCVVREVSLNLRGLENILGGLNREMVASPVNNARDLLNALLEDIENTGELVLDTVDLFDQIDRRSERALNELRATEILGDRFRVERDRILAQMDVVFGSSDMEPAREFNLLSDVQMSVESRQINDRSNDALELGEKALWWFISENQVVCQDGIKLPLRICDVFPVGVVAGYLNLFCESRFSLNVTRNAVDMTETKMKRWIDQTGRLILRHIYQTITSAFKLCNVEYDAEILWTGVDSEQEILGAFDWFSVADGSRKANPK
jgi:hypothetical protein